MRSFLFLFLTILMLAVSCKHEPQTIIPDENIGSTYPDAIAKIMVNKCATAGCHNALSYENASGLQLENWTTLFEGGNSGANIIPFSPAYSSLLYFINTHADLGPITLPTMPLYADPLSREEYLTIANWIADGAPDANGNIPFQKNAETRQKIYLTQQGCDLLAVVDAKSHLLMRYIPIGTTPGIESPHCVRVSKDGAFAYVSFLGGQYIQKIDTKTDKIVDSVFVGVGSWNVLHLSQDGSKMMVSDWQGNGKMVLINANTMTIEQTYAGGDLFVFPHGITSNADFTTFFITAQYGNIIYKLSTDGNYEKLSLDGNTPVTTQGIRDPHEIIMTPDFSKYFVACEASNEVRVMDANADTLLKVIPVGIFPQELAVSRTTPYVFVSCMEDVSAFPNYKGSVYAINYNTYEATRIDGPFYQPHGIAVDDENGTLYIASRNSNPNGPAPHHASSCSGRNGYYHVYDLHSFTRLPRKYEVTVEPYSTDARFK